MEPVVQCRIHKGSPIIPTLRLINPIPRIDIYLPKVHPNTMLPSSSRSSKKYFSPSFTC